MSDIYALDLDEDLLSHFADPEAWIIMQGEDFDPDMIEDQGIREIFLWQRNHLREYKQPATAVVLADQFDLNLEPPETVIGDLLDRMRDRYAKNCGRQALREIVELQKEDPRAIPRLLLKKGRELNEILAKRGEVFGTGDAVRAHHRYDKKVLAGPGASLGFTELDDYFFGMRGVNMWIAPPKHMKSWVMAKGVLENALAGRTPWLYSLELPAEEGDMRIRHLMADIPWWHYVRNCISGSEWEQIHAADELLSEYGGYKVVKPAAGHRGIEELVYTARDGGAEVIFIDQLQYVEGSNGHSIGSLNNTGDYWEVLNRARDLSDDGPICFAHQFNRSTMFSAEMPAVQQAKGSSSIEEVSTLALGMWADKDMRRSNLLQIGTLIARNHEYASWNVEYNLATGCSFEIIERVTDDDQ